MGGLSYKMVEMKAAQKFILAERLESYPCQCDIPSMCAKKLNRAGEEGGGESILDSRERERSREYMY